LARQPPSGPWPASSFTRFLDHTQTHHTRWDSSGRVISPSQRPLPDNTQHSQQTDIHASRWAIPASDRPQTYALDGANTGLLGIKVCAVGHNSRNKNSGFLVCYPLSLASKNQSVVLFWMKQSQHFGKQEYFCSARYVRTAATVRPDSAANSDTDSSLLTSHLNRTFTRPDCRYRQQQF
jgi:hypothetical protein